MQQELDAVKQELEQEKAIGSEAVSAKEVAEADKKKAEAALAGWNRNADKEVRVGMYLTAREAGVMEANEEAKKRREIEAGVEERLMRRFEKERSAAVTAKEKEMLIANQAARDGWAKEVESKTEKRLRVVFDGEMKQALEQKADEIAKNNATTWGAWEKDLEVKVEERVVKKYEEILKGKEAEMARRYELAREEWERDSTARTEGRMKELNERWKGYWQKTVISNNDVGAETKKANEELKGVEGEMEKLRIENANLKAQVSAFEAKDWEKMQSELKGLKEKVGEFEGKDWVGMQKTLKESVDEVQSLKDKVGEWEGKDWEKMEKELNDLKDKVEEYEKRDWDGMGRALKEAKEEVEGYKATTATERHQFKKDLLSLGKQLKAKQTEISNLRRAKATSAIPPILPFIGGSIQNLPPIPPPTISSVLLSLNELPDHEPGDAPTAINRFITLTAGYNMIAEEDAELGAWVRSVCMEEFQAMKELSRWLRVQEASGELLGRLSDAMLEVVTWKETGDVDVVMG